MHSFLRKSILLRVGLLGLAAALVLPVTATAKPRPGLQARLSRLLAGPSGALTINRIYCGLAAKGEICVDSLNSSVVGGGFWPKGTPDQYVFNSGLQIAGQIDPAAGFPWAGDTTMGQFFQPRGDDHGEALQPVFNSTNPDDVANWPQAALVPQGDPVEENYDPLLRGRTIASQGDVWFVAWEGNPAFGAGREHPLGIMVEQRGMGWNFPAGNEDILYFVYTFYNITARDPAAYTAIRPGMREIAQQAGARFQDLNEPRFGITIPDAGYSLTNLFAAFGADMDVAEAGANYSTVVVPFSLGNTYEHTFSGTPEWRFDPAIFGAPFFAGAGFVGVKYLKSPIDPVSGQEVGLSLFSNTINAGAFDDATGSLQLYRYLSNNVSTAAGDAACNTGNPQVTHICYINNGQTDDMRFFQSSGPLNLAPGAFQTIVVAYIFAAPVSVGACTAPGACDALPGDPTRWLDAATLAQGANTVDSVMGFAGFADANADGEVQQAEVATVPGSLLGKALTAQAVFDNKFLLPFAPDVPNFFLIPGNNQVTVVWQPSASEATGDPFFSVASQPTTVPAGGGAPVANPLYDPNYRQSDVEGYRIYRGRVDSPNSLQLLAQFDYRSTFISDFAGQVNPTADCAPELGIDAPPVDTDGDGAADVDLCAFDPVAPGVARVEHTDVPLVGQLTQVKLGERAALATGAVILLKVDTAITGATSGCLRVGTATECSLRDTGVPFTFIDRSARSNLRYFYSVTAFDINSFQSGPSSLESARTTKSVTPVAPATNYSSQGTLVTSVFGRGEDQNAKFPSVPSLDAQGRFSGPMPPANGLQPKFVGELAAAVLSGTGGFKVRLDSLTPGEADATDFAGGVAAGTPTVHYLTLVTATDSVEISIPIAQGDLTDVSGDELFFDASPVDASLAGRYGGDGSFVLKGTIPDSLPGVSHVAGWGLGCRFAEAGFGTSGGTACEYNGPRWFDGPSPQNNETAANPNGGNCQTAGNDPVCTVPDQYNNAGALSGVTTVYQPLGYIQINRRWRNFEYALGSVKRAADYNVYWGTGGLVDSVIDVTHNLVVPFGTTGVSSWGILTQAASNAAGSHDTRPDVLTVNDMSCVEPFRSGDVVQAQFECTSAAPFALVNTAALGQIAYYQGAHTNASTAPVRPEPGFLVYVSGEIFLMEMAALPAAGTVWSLRTYSGAITGGSGTGGGATGAPYAFTPAIRPFTAPGAEVRVTFNVTNAIAAATENDLRRVHTVPDPYYVTNAFEQTTDSKIIKFVNLPADAVIRLYSSSGVLVALLEHHSASFGGEETWNVRNRNNQVVASGVYFYHIEAGGARRVGRFTVVNFSQ